MLGVEYNFFITKKSIKTKGKTITRICAATPTFSPTVLPYNMKLSRFAKNLQNSTNLTLKSPKSDGSIDSHFITFEPSRMLGFNSASIPNNLQK